MQLVDLKGKFKEDGALVDCSSNSLRVYSAVVQSSVENAKAGAWRTAYHNVWFLLLDEAPRLSPVSGPETNPAAPVAVLAQV